MNHPRSALEAVLPNVKSAEKRMRTNRIREERNKAARSRLRTAIKKVRQSDTADAEGTEATYLQAKSLLDRAARKRLIHPNKAARLKSQLARASKTA
jgi:small subunit ribosomal protein S20